MKLAVNHGTERLEKQYMRSRAIVLLSGGLDSTTCLAWAQARYECIAISFMYGQRSTTELDAAKALPQRY